MSAQEETLTFRELLEADEAEYVESWTEPDRTGMDVRLDWLLERIAKRQAQIARNNAIATERIRPIEDWRQGENAKIERSISWFQWQIRNLVPATADEFERAYGKRSRSLPFGTIGYKKHPDKVEVYDEDRAIAWAKARGLDVTVKESVSKTVLKKALQAGQDEPDGFEIIRGLDEFYVRSDTLAEEE